MDAKIVVIVVAVFLERLTISPSQQRVSGYVVVDTGSKAAMSHLGVELSIRGDARLELSAKSVGLFEAFYSSVKPIVLIAKTISVAGPGEAKGPKCKLPFEFLLIPTQRL